MDEASCGDRGAWTTPNDENRSLTMAIMGARAVLQTVGTTTQSCIDTRGFE